MVINYGKTHSGCQRYKCKKCHCTYTFHNRINKINREKIWFVEWIIEGYSVRQLVKISRRGIWKIKQIINYWLNQEVPEIKFNSKTLKYLIFDGTYFKHENCLLLLLNSSNGKAISYDYQIRENYATAFKIFNEVKAKGVKPIAITVDGNTSVIRALKTVWPDIIIQRCLVHIQRQGLAWLRKYPKLEASKELRKIFLMLFKIETYEKRNYFYRVLVKWEKLYGEYVLSLPSDHKVYGDLQRARSLLHHAWPDMFHYLNDRKIASTTNQIEGYFSIVKSRYKQHHGLTKTNRKKYLFWFIYLKNNR